MIIIARIKSEFKLFRKVISDMHVQPVTNQIASQGKIRGVGVMLLKDSHWDVPAGMDKSLCIEIPDNMLNKMRAMIKDKPYDVFISQNKNSEFLNVDANSSFENVKKGIQGKVKVNRNALEAFPQAIQDAIDIFEEHLAALKIRENILSKESV